MALAYLAVLLMIAEYFLFVALVALARGRYKVHAPAITGHPDFERRFRVQQNTLEQLIGVIPATFIMALTLSPLWAAVCGLAFVAARAWYAWGYYRSAPGRHWGYVAGAWASAFLIGGAAFGSVRELLAR